MLAVGVRFQIGSGSTVSLWNDPWLPLPNTFKPFSSPMCGRESWLVEDIIDTDERTWLVTVIEDMFTEVEAEFILKIPLSLRPRADRIVWHYDRKGLFTVKSGYKVARDLYNRGTHASSSSGSCRIACSLWHLVWHARIPPKVRAFIWRSLRGILPTVREGNTHFSLSEASRGKLSLGLC